MRKRPITTFHNEFRFLSNFWVEQDGKSVEHYFQAGKTMDLKQKQAIVNATTPAAAKAMGRSVVLRTDWEEIKIPLMTRIVTSKFQSDIELAKRLLRTSPCLLVENNGWHDNEWGDCQCGRQACKQPGHNWLGVILMTVRATL